MIHGHETRWGMYNSHSYDIDLGESGNMHVIEELFDDTYGYFKAWVGDFDMIMVHEFTQPRSRKTGKFCSNVEIVGSKRIELEGE